MKKIKLIDTNENDIDEKINEFIFTNKYDLINVVNTSHGILVIYEDNEYPFSRIKGNTVFYE